MDQNVEGNSVFKRFIIEGRKIFSEDLAYEYSRSYLNQLHNPHQILHYTYCITPKRVKSWRRHFYVIASGQSSF